jgi:hypothetical protein
MCSSIVADWQGFNLTETTNTVSFNKGNARSCCWNIDRIADPRLYIGM